MLLHLVVTLGLGLSSPTLQLDELDQALLEAARSGDAEAVGKFIDQGADIEVRVPTQPVDEDAPQEYVPEADAGATPLILAMHEGHMETVRLLLDKGADVNARDAAQFTAMERAAFDGHLGRVEFLLEHGASAVGDSRALTWAARQGMTNVVQMLLDAGADPNAPMPLGWTPLMFAAQSGEASIVSALISSGADVNAVSINGYTALRCARERGREDIAEALEKAGAKPSQD